MAMFGEKERFGFDDQDQGLLNGVVIDVDEVTHKAREIVTVKLLEEK